jgi:hypothetical protein
MARVEKLVAGAIGALARLRRDRAVHARGRTYTGTLTLPAPVPGVAALDRPGPLPVLVRVSRAAGLPPWLPDVYGLALRLVDAYGPGRHQDLLLDSCPPPPLDRLPLPRYGPAGRYGSLVGYRVAGRRLRIGATLRADRTGTLSLGADTGTLRIGPALDEPADHRIRFDPASAGPGLAPASRLLTVRRPSYQASRRQAPPPG